MAIEGKTRLDVAALEQWLWDAACQIRGPLDAPKFRTYILPLAFLRSLSDVFQDEVSHLTDEFGDGEVARLRLLDGLEIDEIAARLALALAA